MERTEIVICRCPAGVGDEVEAEAEAERLWLCLATDISRVVIWANTYGSQLVWSSVNIIISPI